MKELSIIIPTYKERDNIKAIIGRVSDILNALNIIHEIIIVDDNSPDGTAKIAKSLSDKYPVRVIVRNGRFGLASAILTGFMNAKGDILGVIDADMQHPPELMAELIRKIKDGYDIAIASRYVKGGGIEDWGFLRKLVSKGAIMLAKPLTKVKDPISGYFLLRRSVIDGVQFNLKGYKLLLEILVKGKYRRVAEVPYTFKKRMMGESKLKASEYWKYLRLLTHLYKTKFLRCRSK